MTGVPAVIHQIRAENFAQHSGEKVDAVTARALAPLKTLCNQVFPLIQRGAVGLFPKGQDVDAELTEAAKYWNIKAAKVPSKTSPEGKIVVMRCRPGSRLNQRISRLTPSNRLDVPMTIPRR